ncbi:MAG: nitrate/nitrite transporter NrtS [Phycisphaerae bacterium]
MTHHPESWTALAASRTVVLRAMRYAVIVGAVLITINHGDALIAGDVTVGRGVKMGLTLLVPYTVSTLSSVGAIRSMQSADRNCPR